MTDVKVNDTLYSGKPWWNAFARPGENYARVRVAKVDKRNRVTIELANGQTQILAQDELQSDWRRTPPANWGQVPAL